MAIWTWSMERMVMIFLVGRDTIPPLKLYGIPCLYPGLKTAQDRSYFFITVVQQDERRTGACMLVLSGTVRNDPLFLVELQTRWVRLNRAQRNGNRTRDVTRFVCLRAAHIYDDRVAALERQLRFLERNARHL